MPDAHELAGRGQRQCRRFKATRRAQNFRSQLCPAPESLRSRSGWRTLDFVETIGDQYAKDLGALTATGDEYPALVVYRKDGDKVRVFYAAEMPFEAADPGQGTAYVLWNSVLLWNLLDLTPEGRGQHWYPKLEY